MAIKSDKEEVEMSLRALADVIEWFGDRRAQAVIDNLNEGASEEALAAAEEQLGYALPPGLKAVYRERNGQRELEMGNQLLRHGIGAFLDWRSALLLTPRHIHWIISPPEVPHVSPEEREGWLSSVLQAVPPRPERSLTPEWFPISRFAERRTQLRGDECSTAWLMFAWQDTFSGWINLRSGRVFSWAKGEGLAFEADSFGEFLAGFADDLWNERLALERDPFSGDDDDLEARPWIWRG